MTGPGRTVFHNPWNDYHTPTITPKNHTGKTSLITHPIIPQSTNSTTQSYTPARTVHNCPHVQALWTLSALCPHRARLHTCKHCALGCHCRQLLAMLTIAHTAHHVSTVHICTHYAPCAQCRQCPRCTQGRQCPRCAQCLHVCATVRTCSQSYA